MTKPHPIELFFSSQHPISRHLGVRVLAVEDRTLSVAVEAGDCFLADAETGEMHSGLASLVLDTVFGGAVMGTLDRLQPIATIGLTTQHLRRPARGEGLVCRARMQGIHDDVAHVTGHLESAATGEVLSTATGSFMIGTRSKPLGVRL